MAERRIVLGKTGTGKCSLANTILEKQVLKLYVLPKFIGSKCDSETSEIHGRKITTFDTPGFFDTKVMENNPLFEMAKRVTPIIRRLEYSSTQLLKEAIFKMKEFFSEKAKTYARIVFAHRYQLENQNIEKFVNENCDLQDSRYFISPTGGNSLFFRTTQNKTDREVHRQFKVHCGSSQLNGAPYLRGFVELKPDHRQLTSYNHLTSSYPATTRRPAAIQLKSAHKLLSSYNHTTSCYPATTRPPAAIQILEIWTRPAHQQQLSD
ncbi:GTPase IMAP family member 2 isoform X1 [Oryzias melastigma]|uniref:GTPase IMAP family member 2-like n=1 Tax=Oryzias melastigma TaxID=30732 RepID=A0A3B3CGU5_ORYME|nr:GTPase IMAP family member 2 isoform X1 [Oryzias melastigma]